MGQGVDAAHNKRHGKTAPHDSTAKKRLDHPVPTAVFDHRQGYLGNWKSQAFVLDPAAPHDNPNGNEGQVEGRVEDQPVEQRGQPAAPGDGAHPRAAFVEAAHGFRLAHHHPVGQVGVDYFGPFVFGGGVVEGARDHGQEHAGHSPGGDGSGHHHHDGYGDQFAPLETPATLEQSQHGMNQYQNEEQQAESRWRGRRDTHRRPLDDHGSIGHPHGDDGTQQAAEQQTPPGDGGIVPLPWSALLQGNSVKVGGDCFFQTDGPWYLFTLRQRPVAKSKLYLNYNYKLLSPRPESPSARSH